MRKFILPILFLHLAVAVNGATYYFSSGSGDDSRTSSQAQNSSTPWKTITKLNAIMSVLKPGDQVLFKRGETFYGAIVANASGTSSAPILFGAYGSGDKPVISGFSVLWNWQKVSGNIWECPFLQASGNENVVIKGGKQIAIGRYPNANAANGGYLIIDSHSGFTQLTSKQLPSSPDWTGADIAIRKNRWVIDRSTVTYQSGTTLGFVSGSDAPITDKYGFFIENSPSTLDQDGEWWYDKSRAKMRMYFSSSNPNSDYSIKGSTVEQLVTVSFRNYLTFDNLNFTGANQYAFNLTNSNYIKINACDINYTGINAINGMSTGYLSLSNSTINYTNNNGLNLSWNCYRTLITNNLIKNTALFAGMAQNSHITQRGIYIRGDFNFLQYNEIDSSGNDGIHFEGDYSTVQNNFINVFGLVSDDCGGIYTGQGLNDFTVYNAKSIIGNIILKGVGNPKGTDDTAGTVSPATQGVYLDANTNHVTVSGNTVANCGQTGVLSNNSNNINILNNTLFNNGKEQFLFVRQQNPVSNVNVNGNIMFPKTASQLAMRIESYYGSNNLPAMGVVDSNYYCRPIDNNYLFYDMYLSGSTYVTAYDNLSSWRSKFGFDAHGKGAPATIPAFTYSNLSGVNKYSNGSYNTSVGDVGSFASTGDISKVWVASKLDAGTMQVTSNNYTSNNNYMLSLPLNSSISAGKSYLLTFSLQGGANNAPMSVYLRQNTSPQVDLTIRTQIPISTSRQEIKLGLTATGSSSNAAIELDVAKPNGAVWVDNVTLQEATITPVNPDNYILFKYNASATVTSFSLSESYYDAKGNTYSGTVNLQPYTSLVLFKKSGSTTSTTNVFKLADQDIELSGNLEDASADSYTSNSATELTWQVENESDAASYYQVERSTDADHFTEIGRTSAKVNGLSSVLYKYSDAAPSAGKNWYRITQYDEKSVALVSKVVMVNNISFRVNPNPARDVIHLTFDQTIRADDHLGKDIVIRNSAGVTVKTIQLPAVNDINRTDINVAGLKPGTYILSLTSEGKIFSKPFLKL